jgi:hypothetical protein
VKRCTCSIPFQEKKRFNEDRKLGWELRNKQREWEGDVNT